MAKEKTKEPDRILLPGRPEAERCDNKVVSARYTIFTFFPRAIAEQFRRFANLYFLFVGVIMAIGYYTTLYESAISPWTTLGPLSAVVSLSLLVEGGADYQRHRNDEETNTTKCVILRRSEELEEEESVQRDDKIMNGRDVVVNINKAYYATSSGPRGHKPERTSSTNPDAKNVDIAFQKVRRMDIRQGHFVLVRNREMVPADMLLLASSNDGGSAYIETSSIDGETNLKLRTSPRLPKEVRQALRSGKPASLRNIPKGPPKEEDVGMNFETIEEATKRIVRFSYLGRPEGISSLTHPSAANGPEDSEQPRSSQRESTSRIFSPRATGSSRQHNTSFKQHYNDGRYIAALTTEPPNPSVHTFQGKLTLPPFDTGGEVYDIPLGSDNVVLRGAVIRNTEWIIGVAFFTGNDTKLVQNSFQTPSKFSQLDILMNWTVVAILCIMIISIATLSTLAVSTNEEKFDELFYAGFNANSSEPWPYLPAHFEPPEWETETNSWVQFFFLYVTLLNNFIPLSLYITVEVVTFCMLWFINVDLDMYDDTTNTRAVARSTIVTDLGRVQYIFSDKTGTLTQNVMRFKRCSVDGMAFGAPIEKSKPTDSGGQQQSPWHPLRHLLVGKFVPQAFGILGFTRSFAKQTEPDSKAKLTFNAEMFLRIMALCHTVVVEKDIDQSDYISSGASQASSGVISLTKRLFRRRGDASTSSTARSTESYEQRPQANNDAGTGKPADTPSPPLRLGAGLSDPSKFSSTASTSGLSDTPSFIKGSDGAPHGFAYQAESPDEGALVSAASLSFGFQVVSRDSNGIKLRVARPSHLEDKKTVRGLRSGNLALNKLAADTASSLDPRSPKLKDYPDPSLEPGQREEVWSILAVNKFDSDRKRMSILLRSPPELGNLPILFCKGADSAMLDPSVCESNQLLDPTPTSSFFPDLSGFSKSLSVRGPSAAAAGGGGERELSALTTVSEQDEDKDDDQGGWEVAQMLGIQAHLGDFASEGLRTLVLGMRVLSERECETWLTMYKAASVSLTQRSKLLAEAALAIETNLHIAGATAIEDKLQKGVPDTIATLEKAGIKLWVLTGDKRETAVEIGYATHVLTPKMVVTEVGDEGKDYVRTLMAMEFIRLVKKGKLPEYQHSVFEGPASKGLTHQISSLMFALGKVKRRISRVLAHIWAMVLAFFRATKRSIKLKEKVADSVAHESMIIPDLDRFRRVREKVDQTVKHWVETHKTGTSSRRLGKLQPADDLSLVSEETPKIFTRASSARSLLKGMRASGKLSQAELRRISLAHMTAQNLAHDHALVDEDVLSLESFYPAEKDDLEGNFDARRRTVLERLFAIDQDMRKGKLRKHVFPERLEPVDEDDLTVHPHSGDHPRALVIEGAALKHLLGDPIQEEILFAVASTCDAVIACRVSPKQKALLVNLVRYNVKPTPITLAIGDGANDVGMIQEAHIGVGISGKEGKQAVNASDFAIAQFRFLEELVLIHGRWNFFRLSTVVLYSFYKNAVMAGTLIFFATRTVFSGTPLFDEWLIAMLNFVAGAPIILTGLFDRCLSKEYVRRHPEVYKASRENELITFRTLLRWVTMVLVHVVTLYILTVPQHSLGGGISNAFDGLVWNRSRENIGDGEGGDLKSAGTVTYTCFVVLLAYKVLFETRSLVHGRWPAITCGNSPDGFLGRLAYTWHGVVFTSLGFYFFMVNGYQLLGRLGANNFSQFVDTPNHVFTRLRSWLLILFVPIIGMTLDVTGKLFSNLFYPTQTQIHLETEALERAEKRRRRQEKDDEFVEPERPEGDIA